LLAKVKKPHRKQFGSKKIKPLLHRGLIRFDIGKKPNTNLVTSLLQQSH